MVDLEKTLTSLVIQAGGESRRMGQNKALMPFLGRPLIERVLERIHPIGSEIIITSNQPEVFAYLGHPVFPDILPGQGALSGLLTALSVANYPLVAVVACDMPFASLDLFELEREKLLVDAVDAVVPQSSEGFEPFHAIYRCETCLPAVQSALEAGEKRLISWFPQVKVSFLSPREVLERDPSGYTFININTPDEAQSAEKLAQGLP
jgi:molybdopterin-guanine dinucleotide biosynthesis protein A